MTMTQIYYFYILAKTGNFTRTSQQLYITQPTLSKSISALEDEIKVKLIERWSCPIKIVSQCSHTTILWQTKRKFHFPSFGMKI